MNANICDKRELKFVMFEHLRVQELTELEAFSDFNQELLEMTLDEIVRFATEVLAPTNVPADREGVRVEDNALKMPEVAKKAYQQLRKGGWISINKKPELGGGGLPEIMTAAMNELVSGTANYLNLFSLLTRGACDLIGTFGSDEQKALYCERMYTGQWAGTMCLTEPQAGSMLGGITTVATPDGDHYRMKGSKSFITFGDHDLTENIVHLVLARTPGAPEGTAGISLFIVPKYRVSANGSLQGSNDVALGGVEHKMGIHASPTCVINFGENDGCHGYLVGELHAGLRQMFKLMNEARLEVGQQSLGLAAMAYDAALNYSKERLQGADALAKPNAAWVPIIAHADVRRMLLWMKAVTEGVRALCGVTAKHLDLSHHHPDPEQRKLHKGYVALFTPICKAYGSDMGFRVTEQAIQVYGGYGYISEYPVEQCCRDIKICSLYEGTNGIQAIDLLRRKVLSHGGALFKQYVEDVQGFIAANAEHESIRGAVAQLKVAVSRLQQSTKVLGERAGALESVRQAFVDATPYLAQFGHVVTAHLLLEQALIAQNALNALLDGRTPDAALIGENAEVRFYANKVQTALFFSSRVLPESEARAQEILAGDDSALRVVF